MKSNRASRAFTSTELVVVLVCLVIFGVIALTQFPPFSASTINRPLKEKTQIKLIHQAMLIFADFNNGRLPTPGLLSAPFPVESEFMQGADPHDHSQNHTSSLYSSMIAMEYFGTDLLISPVENSSGIREAVDYNFDAYQPSEGSFWDPEFKAHVGDHAIGSNVSYAHLSLCGDRWSRNWRSDANPATPVLGNRGTKNGEYDTENYFRSPTLEFHGPRDQWIGYLALADNSTTSVISFFFRYGPIPV
ncbi:MAG: hypothetical protein O7G85_12310 [Planctomycetota bacterium]|nr:hypothetical protein [Planctomycetota bacterium]